METKSIRAETLDQLEALCRETVNVPLLIANKAVEIPLRLLTPAEQASLQVKLAEVHPPLITEDGKQKYDFSNPEYLKRVAEHTRSVRSLGLYWSCPLFQAAKPGLKDSHQIHEFVMSQLTEAILETLWKVVYTDGSALEELVNFTLPPDKTPN